MKCKICKENLERPYWKHLEKHRRTVSEYMEEFPEQREEFLKCPHCGWIASSLGSLTGHVSGKHREGSKKTQFKKGFKPWNKGLTKDESKTLQKLGQKVSRARRGRHFPKENHKQEILRLGKRYKNEGIKFFPVSESFPRPDAVVVDNGKISAIEVEKERKDGSIQRKKHQDREKALRKLGYDNIIWHTY